MKLDARKLFVPIVVLGVLGLMVQQTLGALKASGSWRQATRAPVARLDDPYTRIDNLIGAGDPPLSAERIHNPFAYGSNQAAPTGLGLVKPLTPKLRVPPPPPPRPSLTSILWDSDPRATVRYAGRDYSVRANSTFAEFTVTSISANQIVLDRNGESITLTLRPKGD